MRGACAWLLQAGFTSLQRKISRSYQKTKRILIPRNYVKITLAKVILRTRCAGKSLPARESHPHRQTAPTQMSPHKFSPQTRFHDLALKTFTSLTKSFVDSFRYRPFFPAEKNLYFLKMGKHLCFTEAYMQRKLFLLNIHLLTVVLCTEFL